MNKYLKLLISLALPQLAGGLGAFFTVTAVESWYSTLVKPSWNPPSWLFGPVWIFLYILMGIACYLIWNSDHPQKRALLKLYFIQLILNALWSPVFFGMKSPLLGLLVITPLWVAIVLCVIQFRRVSTFTSGLMVPYLLWVTFATALNTVILLLN